MPVSGIPVTLSIRALKDLDQADTDQDGSITYNEWLNYYQKHAKDTRNLLPAFQVLLYEPNYSCSPPAVFILLLSILQVCTVQYSTVQYSTVQYSKTLTIISDGFLHLELLGESRSS